MGKELNRKEQCLFNEIEKVSDTFEKLVYDYNKLQKSFLEKQENLTHYKKNLFF